MIAAALYAVFLLAKHTEKAVQDNLFDILINQQWKCINQGYAKIKQIISMSYCNEQPQHTSTIWIYQNGSAETHIYLQLYIK